MEADDIDAATLKILAARLGKDKTACRAFAIEKDALQGRFNGWRPTMKRSRLPLGFEFYTKYVVFGDRNAGAARYITLTFAYPTSQRNIYDPAVTKINFRILGAQLLTTDFRSAPHPAGSSPLTSSQMGV